MGGRKKPRAREKESEREKKNHVRHNVCRQLCTEKSPNGKSGQPVRWKLPAR